jgi:hypothetical protein
MRPPNQWVLRTSGFNNVPQKVFLPIVGCEDADLAGWVAQQAHEAAMMVTAAAAAAE